MEKIYFAHPINIYNEPIETAFETLISFRFPCIGIENPNQPHHQEDYRKWSVRQKEHDTKHKGMNYFYDEVLPHCFGCVALPFLDERMGLGVAGEALWFVERGKLVYIIVPTKRLSSSDIQRFINEPLNGSFVTRELRYDEEKLLRRKDPRLVVAHEETRLRTWLVYNRERRTYEEAHLVTMPIPEGFYPEEKM